MSHVRTIVSTLALALFASALCGREWTDSSGGFRVEAKLVSVKDQKAYLEKSGGAVVAVPLTKLSWDDLEYLLTLPEHREYFDKNPIPGMQQAAAINVEDESKVGVIRQFPRLLWGIESLAFSPDGRFLAAGKPDRKLIIFDVNKATRVGTCEASQDLGQITALAFTPNGRKLLAGCFSGRIHGFNVAPDGESTEANHFIGHSDGVITITVGADGKTVLSGGEEEKVRCWDLESGRELFVVNGFKGSVKASYLTRSGKQGLACDGETLALIDIAQGKIIETMKLARRTSQAVVIAPDGLRIVVGDGRAMRMWNTQSGKEYSRMEQDRETVRAVAFSPDCKYILSGDRRKINLWEAATQRRLYEFDILNHDTVDLIAFSPDGQHFAAAAGSGGRHLLVFRLPAELASD